MLPRPGDTLGDISGDGDVNSLDSQRFWKCIHGPGLAVSGVAATADLDADGDVDLRDFTALQRLAQPDDCLLVGDLNRDCALTDADTDLFMRCLDNDRHSVDCLNADLDNSVTIDLRDIAIYQRALTRQP